MADLFADARRKNRQTARPLAARMRPRTLDEFVGQRHLLAPGKLLRRMIEADRLASVLFYGPPGTGKTTLAELVAGTTRSHFHPLNAASVGVKEVRVVLDGARERLEGTGTRTVLFVDEIHRFNKAQQDVLLGDVEEGVVILVGATTENPFFAVNSALVSRSQIFQFEPIGEADLAAVVRRAADDADRGLGRLDLVLDDDAVGHWARTSDGDARRALAALEVAVLSLQKSADPGARLHIDLEVAQESIQRKALVFDRDGDAHYDHASALIKSMRGSDPDAAIYWLARVLESGEDPRFVTRRVAIFASEDVGNADPRALLVAQAAYDLVLKLGMPEAGLTLSQAVIYMARAPKSRACCTALASATRDVRELRTVPVPRRLRDAHYAGAARLGHGSAAAASGDEADYLGVDATYYHPTGHGEEGLAEADPQAASAEPSPDQVEAE